MTREQLIECMAKAECLHDDPKCNCEALPERHKDSYRESQAAIIDALTAAGMVVVPKKTLHDLYMDQLENAFNAGIVRPDGTWWSGGMSDAEWLERICKMPAPINAEALQERLPHIASSMTEAANG